MPRFATLLAACLLLVPLACRPERPEPEPELADPALVDCVEDQAGSLEEGDLADLQHLECQDAGIASLEGMELLPNLETLSLFENEIEDISPLAALSDLEELQLGANRIGDVSPLAELAELSRLGLGSNRVEDLAPLAGLAELRWLDLDDNAIDPDSLSALCDLDELRWLTIEHNELDDVDDELDCLEDLDEIYWGYQEEGGGERSSGEHVPGAGVGERGRLELLRGEDGILDFRYHVAGHRYPVHADLSGDLLADGTRIVLHLGERATEVGRIDRDGWVLCGGEFAQVCSMSVGRKYFSGDNRAPATGEPEPVFTLALTLRGGGWNLPGMEVAADEEHEYGDYYDEMDPYILASPNQFDAGSCLFMANTGAMEMLLGQHADPDDIDYEGDTDLSERYLMSGSDPAYAVIDYSITDIAYAYEYNGGALLNRDYPFQCTNSSCQLNWDNDMPDDWRDMLVPTPEVERTVLFLDPDLDDNSIWAVGIMGPNVLDRIKYELRTKNAPVVVVYNHYLYWHAVVVVGYDDTAPTNCSMVNSSMSYFEDEGATSYVNAIEDHMDDVGGCLDHGVFFVRDSIYDGDDEPIYDYGPWSDHYSARIVELSYNWALFLGNHVYSVHRK